MVKLSTFLLILKDELVELKAIVMAQGMQLERQEKHIAELKHENRETQAMVAFMTTIADFSTNYTDDDTVVFNEIIQDTESGAFDPSTGRLFMN